MGTGCLSLQWTTHGEPLADFRPAPFRFRETDYMSDRKTAYTQSTLAKIRPAVRTAMRPWLV